MSLCSVWRSCGYKENHKTKAIGCLLVCLDWMVSAEGCMFLLFSTQTNLRHWRRLLDGHRKDCIILKQLNFFQHCLTNSLRKITSLIGKFELYGLPNCSFPSGASLCDWMSHCFENHQQVLCVPLLLYG